MPKAALSPCTHPKASSKLLKDSNLHMKLKQSSREQLSLVGRRVSTTPKPIENLEGEVLDTAGGCCGNSCFGHSLRAHCMSPLYSS